MNRARTFSFLAAAAVAAGTVAAGAQGAADARPLEQTWWRLTSIKTLHAAALDAAPRVVIRFVQGRVDGFAGCNRASGHYTMGGDRLTLGPLTKTVNKCPEAAATLEDALRQAFAVPVRYAVTGDRLTLTPESGETMVFEAEPTEPLEGVEWKVSTFADGRGGMATPVTGSRPAFAFADGAVRGNFGCNLFRADYTRDSDRLAFGPLASTRKSCPEPGISEQEQSLLALLAKVASWTIRDHQLVLSVAGGETALTAARSE